MSKKGRKKESPQTELQPELGLALDESEDPPKDESPIKPAGKLKAKGKKPAPEAEASSGNGVAKEVEKKALPIEKEPVEKEPVEKEPVEAETEGANGAEPPGTDGPVEPEPEAVVGAVAGAVDEEETASEPEGPRLIKLVNSLEGCWKELDDGSKVDLDEEEWRSELARNFGRPEAGGD